MKGVLVLLGFSHLGVGVRDIEKSARFYQEVFGFSVVYWMDFEGNEVATAMEQEGGFRSVMLRRDDVRLELLQWVDVPISGGGRKPMTELGITHLAFRVEDLDVVAEQAKAFGGEVVEQTRTVLGAPDDAAAPRLLYLTDPDGARIELMQNVPDLSTMGAAG